MVSALAKRVAQPRPFPDSLQISIDETAALQPRGDLPPLSSGFDRVQLTPAEAREILVDLPPGPTEAEVTEAQLADVRDRVRAEQNWSAAGRAFKADHPDTLQTFRLGE